MLHSGRANYRAQSLLNYQLMRIMIPIAGDRISPVLDVARHFALVDVDETVELSRLEICIKSTGLVLRARRIAELGPDALICGAISRSLEALLVSLGIRVIPNTCGTVEHVVHAFISGQLTEQTFLMPGCRGQRRRLRRRQGRAGPRR